MFPDNEIPKWGKTFPSVYVSMSVNVETGLMNTFRLKYRIWASDIENLFNSPSIISAENLKPKI